MIDLSASARRLYHHLVGRTDAGQDAALQERVGGEPAEGDGASAVAAVEALACGAGGPGPATGSALARAIGLQTSGLRAAAFLSGQELASHLDLLAQAARRRLPLVVHLTAGRDHSAYHAAAASGALQLFATDAQEAVDLTLIARRVAEEALVTAVVAMDGETAASVHRLMLPAAETARRYLGEAAELIHPPTPSQTMLFGKHRRRVPRWHDLERPLLTGAGHTGDAATAAAAARQVFFEAHLPALLDAALDVFAHETGRRYEALHLHHTRGAQLLLVAQGAAVAAAEAVAQELRASGGPRVDVVGVRSLRPLPAGRLAEALRGHRAVAVLERIDAPARGLTAEIGSLAADGERPPVTQVIYGLGGAPLRKAEFTALCGELRRGEAELASPLYLGLDTTATTAYPKRQAHLDGLRRDYPEISRLGLRGAADADEAPAESPSWTPPAAVRDLGRGTSPLADLPGFRDRMGDPIADPFLASATVPPLTAALAAPPPDVSLPAFEPALCTGCGDCWSVCPDGAVGPLVIGIDRLLDRGMQLASRRGASVDKLRMVTAKLADRVRRRVAEHAEGGAAAGQLLDAAFEPLIDKMKLPDERKEAIREAYAAVRDEIAELPVARTAPFFDEPEAASRGSGELFALAIDPQACKGCGLCVAACEPHALVQEAEASAAAAAEAQSSWRLMEELPAPGEATLEQAREHPDVGPLAGALLAREARQVMAAAPGSEAGSGEALAIRQILGAAASRLLPLSARRIAEVEELREELAAAIHQGLADALPDRDLDALARGLDALQQPEADLADLTDRVETAFDNERVDVGRTRRLVDAARAVADVKWQLETGEGGNGRAPFGLIVAGSPADWAGGFPHNAFALPVTVGVGDHAAEMATGILVGHLRQALADVRDLRQARAELEHAKRGGNRPPESVGELSWEDLSPEERRFCPPVFVLDSEGSLSAAPAGALAALAGDLPLKLVALADPGAGGAAFDLGLQVLAGKEALVAQTSIGHPDHLADVVSKAIELEGPAFVRVLAPSPARGGFAADATLEQARRSVAEGDFSLWCSDPAERSAGLRDVVAASMSTVPVAGAAEETTEEAVPPPPAQPAPAAEVAAIEQRHAAELAALHAEVAKLAALRADDEARMAQLRSGLQTEMAQRVRGRLLELVARGAPAEEPGDGRPREADG